MDNERRRLKAQPFKGSKPCPGLDLPDLQRPCNRTISANKFFFAECADLFRAAARRSQEVAA